MAQVHGLEIFVGIVAIAFVLGVIINNYTEVSIIRASSDGRRYVVRNLPDRQEAANTLGTVNENLIKLVKYMKEKSPDDENVRRLARNFNPDNVSESSDKDAYTSYSINKGEKVVLCIRSKKTGKIQDINLLMYVSIHELAHIMTSDVGHTQTFWANNKLLLQNAIDVGVYEKEDYASNPREYCGISISSTIV
jgi:hypothetical protein